MISARLHKLMTFLTHLDGQTVGLQKKVVLERLIHLAHAAGQIILNLRDGLNGDHIGLEPTEEERGGIERGLVVIIPVIIIIIPVPVVIVIQVVCLIADGADNDAGSEKVYSGLLLCAIEIVTLGCERNSGDHENCANQTYDFLNHCFLFPFLRCCLGLGCRFVQLPGTACTLL